MVGTFGLSFEGCIVCFARRGSEDRKLRDALCIRAAPRIPNRRLDRARFEAELLAESKENDSAAATRIFRNVFWETRRIRAAVFVSSCARDIANLRSVEGFFDPDSFRGSE